MGPFLVWQQPHPIYYAELVYRERPSPATLERYRDGVRDSGVHGLVRVLGRNAVRARAPPAGRAGDLPEGRDAQHGVRARLLALGTRDGPALAAEAGTRPRAALAEGARRSLAAAGARRPYLFAETAPASYDDPRWARDHPSLTGALGMLPGEGVDREAMRRSLDWIWATGPGRTPGAGTTRSSRCARPGSASPAAPSTRCCWTRRRTPTSPTATTTSGPAHDLPAGERRALGSRRDDGSRLGRRAGRGRARLPARRQLDGALGGPAPHALSRAHEVLESCAWCARNWGEPSTTTCGASVHGGSSRSVAAASGKEA